MIQEGNKAVPSPIAWRHLGRLQQSTHTSALGFDPDVVVFIFQTGEVGQKT